MNDLISRQAAIDELDKIPIRGMKEDGKFLHALVSIAQVWNMLEQLPSAQQWIPCSERLPEGNTIVLATTADYMYIVEFEVYSNGHMYWNEVNEYRSIEGVIAWMPLPPSFKEE